MTRLYAKARVLGFKRGKRNQKPTTSLIQIEGVKDKEEAQFYLGKRIAYVYKAHKARGTGESKSKIRIIWGKVVRSHGNGGVVKSQFRQNLPPHSFGASARVMLYPSNV